MKTNPQITPVPSPGATLVPFSEATGRAGQAQINADLKAKRNDPPISRISQIEKKKENIKVYRGRYVEPERISSEEANTSHKVIYCVASLE